ncbi:MAG TPA: hypothetical protein VJT49_24720 [Amycolatopsis sp.]|uniref:hypothetical protein n=1 Tax=Amycolatopsis sp. TaxID=37632 RepID=UPI002B49A896|nr:hypothetical protein [Amycolatopsis sp.]HKS48254.1 hypothetical protein [Amycolatopsis sp.]
MYADDLDERASAEFRDLCAARTDDGAALRGKVIKYLETLLNGDLSGEFRLAARVALNLHPPAAERKLERRMSWLAREWVVDSRTVRRRIDDAFGQIAANAAAATGMASGAGLGGDGWYVDMFEAIVRLDVGRPEAIEKRTIVATVPELRKIVHSTNVPRPAVDAAGQRDLELELVSGGLLERHERTGSNFRYEIALAGVLARGQRHDYWMIARIPAGQTMAQHYVCVPLRTCRNFSLVVRFDRNRLPGRVWRVDGVAPRVIDDRLPGPDRLMPDAAGEVRAEFHDLLPGCGYGIQWE